MSDMSINKVLVLGLRGQLSTSPNVSLITSPFLSGGDGGAHARVSADSAESLTAQNGPIPTPHLSQHRANPSHYPRPDSVLLDGISRVVLGCLQSLHSLPAPPKGCLPFNPGENQSALDRHLMDQVER